MTKSKKNYFVTIVLTLLALFILVRIYYKATDDFRTANITYKMPHHQEWEIDDLSAAESNKINAILDQQFTYIGKGAQSYAFGSEDGKYVLKFFKFKHLRPNWFVNSFPNIPPFGPYRDQLTLRKHRKLYGVFNGYHVGYTADKDETGLIYVHLNTGDDLKRSITVTDKIGLKHTIDLDKVPFVIQEKGVTFAHHLKDLLSNNQLDLAKTRIRQILDLYHQEYKKGLFDKDHGLMHNTGFVGEKPFHLDVGKLTKNESMKIPTNYQPDMEFLAWKIETWIRSNFPEFHEELTKDISAKLTEIFGRPFDFKNNPKPALVKQR